MVAPTIERVSPPDKAQLEDDLKIDWRSRHIPFFLCFQSESVTPSFAPDG